MLNFIRRPLALLAGALLALGAIAPSFATVQYTTTHRNTVMNDIVTALGTTPYLMIVSGTEPANVATADTGTVLVALPGSNPVGTVSGGVLTFSAFTTTAAVATGTATHYLLCTTSNTANCLAASSTTRVAQGTVGTSGADLNLPTTSITSGVNVSITSLTYTAAGA